MTTAEEVVDDVDLDSLLEDTDPSKPSDDALLTARSAATSGDAMDAFMNKNNSPKVSRG